MSSKLGVDPGPEESPNKENSQLIYSLILIFLIPASILLNTFWGIQKFQKNIETELQNKTILAKTVFANTVFDDLNQDSLLQEKIDKIVAADKEVKDITVLSPVEDGFQVIASSNLNNLGVIYKSLQYTSAWLDGHDITSLGSPEGGSKERSWTIISPLNDASGSKTALLSLQISNADIDALTQRTLIESLCILIVTIFFVLLLLFNHFHFFEYAVLFKRLKEVDKMKDDFISMASHELKTPMAAIKGYMSMLFEGVAGKIDQKAKIHLEKILANIKRLDTLVDALLDVSRLEQGRMKFEMQATDASEIISQVISEIRVEADQKHLKIEYRELPPPHPSIYVDPDRLAQVFDNVIGNAIKYTQKGTVSIYYRIEENHLKIIVQDTGIGMSKQDMRELFRRFYRIRNDKTADIPGTGLGLWITREIVIKMNGEIFAESKEGIGSIFTIIFPIIRENPK